MSESVFTYLVLAASATTTFAICWRASPIGRQLGVMAVPDSARRDHERTTPQVGGIAILAGFAIWLVWALASDARDGPLQLALLLCAFPVAFVGWADDRKHIAPFIRMILVASFGAASVFIDPELAVDGIRLQQFGLVAISLPACMLLTSLSAVGLVSAINMADGRNGLAGSLFVVWFGCLWTLAGGTVAAASGVILLNVAVFLFFNIRGSLFLGDAGTFGLSFLLGLLIATTHARDITPVEVLLAWFAIPLLDCIRLLISRPLRGASPFRPGRDHFHHHLEKIMGRSLSTAFYVAVVGLCSAAVTIWPQLAVGAILLQGAIIAVFVSIARRR